MAIALQDGAIARVTERLAETVGPRRYAMWFDRSAAFDYQPEAGQLRVVVPSRFAANWIDAHLHQAVRQAVDTELGRDVRLIIEPEPERFTGEESPSLAASPQRRQDETSRSFAAGASPAGQTTPAVNAAGTGSSPSSKGPQVAAPMRHKLEDFIVGPSNELAYSAAQRLAEDETAVCQPLFLHGGCGVGKTHLLQGLCRRMQQLNPRARVLYTTGERFTNQYIAAVRHNTLPEFRQRMRQLDLLAVDDVHFIANKQSTQQEFLHSLDEIELGGARLALASDSHPKTIEQFSAALVNRCVRGLVVRVNEPDEPTRRRLMEALAHRRGLTLRPGAVQVLAGRCEGSVREVEGMLTKLHAVVTLGQSGPGSEEPIGRATVDQLLGHEAPGRPGRPIDFAMLKEVVAEEVGVSPAQLVGSSRQRQVVLGRSLLVYLARDLTSMSFNEIAQQMGRTNHSTTISAAKRFARQLESNQPLRLPGWASEPTPVSLLEQVKRSVRQRG